MGYFDGIPNHGNLELTHYLARTFDISKEGSHIFSACMISMMSKRAIELRGALTETGEEYVELRLLKEPEGETKRKLFQFFSKAAKQGVPRQKTLDEYVSEHYENLQNIMAAAKKNGRSSQSRRRRRCFVGWRRWWIFRWRMWRRFPIKCRQNADFVV